MKTTIISLPHPGNLSSTCREVLVPSDEKNHLEVDLIRRLISDAIEEEFHYLFRQNPLLPEQLEAHRQTGPIGSHLIYAGDGFFVLDCSDPTGTGQKTIRVAVAVHYSDARGNYCRPEFLCELIWWRENEFCEEPDLLAEEVCKAIYETNS